MEHDGLRVAGLGTAQVPGRCSRRLVMAGWHEERLAALKKPLDRLLDDQPLLRSRAHA
jgi:hypothetical protein